jgi:plasmid stabilization system protein ParE
MTRPVIVSAQAKRELHQAMAWYDRESPGLGEVLLEEVDATLEKIARYPQIGALAPMVPAGLGARRVLLSRFPFAVVYREYQDQIRVLALAHGQREPGYWRDR